MNPDPLAQKVVGVDIGGTGCKAAVVDVAAGTLASERERIDTPRPATPDAVAGTIVELLDRLGGADLVGLTVPAVVRSGIVRTAANIDESWIGTDAMALFSTRLGTDCFVMNDADAAGVAEMNFGAGRDRRGVVMVVTLGTGIGTAVFTDGVLVPNTELGHIELRGGEAEQYAAGSVREREDLSWHKWGHRVGRYLAEMEKLFSPELIILGGGVSKKFDKYSDAVLEKTSGNTEIVPAHSLNQAGIVGAAHAAASRKT